MTTRQLKQWIVLRKDLNMRKGKMVAQGAHASLSVVLSMKESKNVKTWMKKGCSKVVLGVDSEEELVQLAEIARKMGLPVSLIKDAGVTEFNGVPTLTAFALGPCQVRDATKVVGHLKLL